MKVTLMEMFAVFVLLLCAATVYWAFETIRQQDERIKILEATNIDLNNQVSRWHEWAEEENDRKGVMPNHGGRR